MLHFSDLPAEVRFRIYHYVFRDLKIRAAFSFDKETIETKFACELLYVCNWLHEETIIVFLSPARINISPWIPDCLTFTNRFRASELRYVAVNLGAMVADDTPPITELADNLGLLISLRELTYYYVLSHFVLDEACFDSVQSRSGVQASVVNLKGITSIRNSAAIMVGYYLYVRKNAEVALLLKFWRSNGRPFKFTAQAEVKVHHPDPDKKWTGVAHSVRLKLLRQVLVTYMLQRAFFDIGTKEMRIVNNINPEYQTTFKIEASKFPDPTIFDD